MHEPSLQGKSHDIPKRLVWYAWLRVKENGGAAALSFGCEPFLSLVSSAANTVS